MGMKGKNSRSNFINNFHLLQAEPIVLEKNEQFLKIEFKVISILNSSRAQHTVEVFHAGKVVIFRAHSQIFVVIFFLTRSLLQQDNYSFLIMTLLGPSLSDLRKLVPDSVFFISNINVM